MTQEPTANISTNPEARKALAAFILRTLDGKSDTTEWQRFMVTHYLDQAMEAARRECVRLIGVRCNGDHGLLDADEIQYLKYAAEALARVSRLRV
jgi:hypothetical protein